MNTAEYIIKKLEELGINDYFGVPGDYNFNIINAIENNSQSKWIGCTNELNAGYAADGYARINGYGAIVTTYGVGELSAVNAIAGSYAENIPVVHLVGIPSTEQISNNALLHHNFQTPNYRAFENTYKNVTAATAYLTRENAKMEIDRVLKTLVKEKLPVYIAIPSDIANLDISDRYVSYEWAGDKEVLCNVADKIAEKIKESKAPLIIGDVLVKRFDSGLEYKELISKTKIPHTNLLMGMNLSSMDNPMFLGGYFSDFRNPIAKKYVDETDCIIGIGIINSDINAFGFNLPDIKNSVAIYGNYTYVDGKRYDNVKMSDLLNMLTEIVEPKEIEIDKPNIGYKSKASENAPLTADYLYPRLQEFFRENDIIIAESGTVPLGIAQLSLPESARAEFQLLWGSIGWATPAALGAALAKPQARVVLITGEGAHHMSIMEIGNILRQEIKPIIIVLNNEGYTIERLLSGNPNAKFNDIVKINYSKIARAFDGDIWSTKVNTTDDFDKALKVTHIMNKTCYIEAILDKANAPSLLEDMISSNYAKLTNENKNIMPDSKTSTQTIIEEQESSGSIIYETVVHRGITEE